MTNTINPMTPVRFDLAAKAKAAAAHADWAEKYQPATIDGLILPTALKASFAKIAKSQDPSAIPNILLHGSTGSGKSATLEAIIAESGLDRLYINAADGSTDAVRKFLKRLTDVSFYGHRGVFIDEFDGLSSQAFSLLKGTILRDLRVVNVIFAATNYPDKIPDPIRSRFTCIDLEAAIKKERKELIPLHVERAAKILDIENVGYDRAVITNIIESRFPDMRSWLAELQFRAAGGRIDKL